MDLRERFERRIHEGAVAYILQCIALPPNRREKPAAGDMVGRFDFWFDGGAASIHTGSNEYRFADGTSATVATVPALSITMEFPNGSRVKVQQEGWGLEDAG